MLIHIKKLAYVNTFLYLCTIKQKFHVEHNKLKIRKI